MGEKGEKYKQVMYWEKEMDTLGLKEREGREKRILRTIKSTRPNCARKVREMILFSVLCTVYCGRGCVSLESERGKELA